MFRKGKSTSPRKDKSPRSPSTSQGGDGVTSPRGILSSSTKGATLKLSRKMKVNMDECEGLIRSPAEDVLTGSMEDGIVLVQCSISFGEDCLVAYTDQTTDRITEDQISLFLPFALMRHYHINMETNALLLTHNSKAGKSVGKNGVFTLKGPPDDAAWAQRAIMALDRRVLRWFRYETARSGKGFLDFVGVASDAGEDANIMLMDKRAARFKNGIDAASSEVFGTRFICKWVLRSDPKNLAALKDHNIDCLVIPASLGIVVMVPGLGIMFVMYWHEVFSFGGVKEKLVIDHRMAGPDSKVNFVFIFAFDKQGELADRVIKGLVESNLNAEKSPLPQTYPPAQFVVGLRSQSEATMERNRFKKIADRRSKRLSANLDKDGDLLSVAGADDKGKGPAAGTRYTAAFLAGALTIPEDADEEDQLDPFTTQEMREMDSDAMMATPGYEV